MILIMNYCNTIICALAKKDGLYYRNKVLSQLLRVGKTNPFL